ncbi:MAG: murein biosynthesis integral membrane protein MurJ [Pedosphaera sp.]|nr:murein biosynthesis integral membrane protein MurJ [Pedosphaera sp.]
MSDMLKSSGAMAGATLTSRVLGMVREICYARFMGDGLVAGAFVLAFMIPNLFRRLLGEGALTVAFIPVFKEQEKTKGEKAMWETANALISGLIVVLAGVVGVGLLGISLALAWGEFDEKTTLMLELLRWVFPYLMLICLTAVVMGMLNARGHFFLPALGAVIMNVVMITAVLWLAPRWGGQLKDQVFALAVGVLVAGVAQLLYQLPTLWREGFRPKWISPLQNDSMRTILKRVGPGVLGVAAFQINVLAVYCIGFFMGEHVVASYGYAVRLMELPQGLFSVSLATFLLPALAGYAAEKKYGEFRTDIDEAARHLLFVNLPAAVLLFVMAEPIVQLLFQYGEFDAASTRRVAWALQCLAPSLPGYSLVLILGRAFFALGDVKTPVKISIACLGLNLVLAVGLALQFEPGLRQGAFGIANTISATLNAALLWRALRRRKELAPVALPGLRRQLPMMMGLAGMAGLVAWGIGRGLDGEALALKARLVLVFVPLLGAGVVYWAMSGLVGVDSAKAILGILRRPRRK